MALILDYFKLHEGLEITLSSGAPAGSGLGGSSAIGVTLYKALCEFLNKEVDVSFAVKIVQNIEGKILNQGVPGYQDYYPALLGGILALKAQVEGVAFEQLYTSDLANYLQSHLTLVYSGISRNSGINNWDVYKGFFDKDTKVVHCLSTIAKLSFEAYECIIKKDYKGLLDKIVQEGSVREELSKGIVPLEIKNLKNELKKSEIGLGIKMCGAGGGGCFLIAHREDKKTQVKQLIDTFGMKELEFTITRPLS